MVEHMTIELTALAQSTKRSRLLLRFIMDWRIFLVFELVEVLFQPSFTSEEVSGFTTPLSRAT